MPWLETNPMDERVRFIVALDEGMYSVAELSERFGVSRQCGDRWRRRYLAEGFTGLADRSHAPHHCPHKISARRWPGRCSSCGASTRAGVRSR